MKPPLRFVICFCALFFSAIAAGAEKDGKDAYVASVDRDGVQRVRIVGGDYFFKPNRIVVKVNVPVEFSVSREAGSVPHTLVIQAPQAGMTVDEDLFTEVRKITFTATTPGTYAFYCRNRLLFFKSHRERGQEGILEVVP
ncbi:MAG: cupredoxin domain-containing protein [Betaproteobacteria bacterium]|nr:cupredoxin domain-containing protein [Betaproteobacteria bacterium]